MKARISEILSETPPTAALFVTDDDWEIGSKGGWWIECRVRPSVLVQLEAEVLAQRACELHMGIKWALGLVRDEHAPLSVPTSWGLFTIDETVGPESLHGHVGSIGWRVLDRPAVPDEPMPFTEEQQQTLRSIEEEVHRLGKILTGHLLALTRVCTVGVLAALALIVIGHFLR